MQNNRRPSTAANRQLAETAQGDFPHRYSKGILYMFNLLNNKDKLSLFTLSKENLGIKTINATLNSDSLEEIEFSKIEHYQRELLERKVNEIKIAITNNATKVHIRINDKKSLNKIDNSDIKFFSFVEPTQDNMNSIDIYFLNKGIDFKPAKGKQTIIKDSQNQEFENLNDLEYIDLELVDIAKSFFPETLKWNFEWKPDNYKFEYDEVKFDFGNLTLINDIQIYENTMKPLKTELKPNQKLGMVMSHPIQVDGVLLMKFDHFDERFLWRIGTNGVSGYRGNKTERSDNPSDIPLDTTPLPSIEVPIGRKLGANGQPTTEFEISTDKRAQGRSEIWPDRRDFPTSTNVKNSFDPQSYRELYRLPIPWLMVYHIRQKWETIENILQAKTFTNELYFNEVFMSNFIHKTKPYQSRDVNILNLKNAETEIFSARHYHIFKSIPNVLNAIHKTKVAVRSTTIGSDTAGLLPSLYGVEESFVGALQGAGIGAILRGITGINLIGLGATTGSLLGLREGRIKGQLEEIMSVRAQDSETDAVRELYSLDNLNKTNLGSYFWITKDPRWNGNVLQSTGQPTNVENTQLALIGVSEGKSQGSNILGWGCGQGGLPNGCGGNEVFEEFARNNELSNEVKFRDGFEFEENILINFKGGIIFNFGEDRHPGELGNGACIVLGGCPSLGSTYRRNHTQKTNDKTLNLGELVFKLSKNTSNNKFEGKFEKEVEVKNINNRRMKGKIIINFTHQQNGKPIIYVSTETSYARSSRFYLAYWETFYFNVITKVLPTIEFRQFQTTPPTRNKNNIDFANDALRTGIPFTEWYQLNSQTLIEKDDGTPMTPNKFKLEESVIWNAKPIITSGATKLIRFKTIWGQRPIKCQFLKDNVVVKEIEVFNSNQIAEPLTTSFLEFI